MSVFWVKLQAQYKQFRSLKQFVSCRIVHVRKVLEAKLAQRHVGELVELQLRVPTPEGSSLQLPSDTSQVCEAALYAYALSLPSLSCRPACSASLNRSILSGGHSAEPNRSDSRHCAQPVSAIRTVLSLWNLTRL